MIQTSDRTLHVLYFTMGRKVRNWYCGKVRNIALLLPVMHNRATMGSWYSYASGKVVTLTHCDLHSHYSSITISGVY